MKIKATKQKGAYKSFLSEQDKKKLKEHEGEFWIVFPEGETQSQIWYFREYLVCGFAKWSQQQGNIFSSKEVEVYLLKRAGINAPIEQLSKQELNAAIESVKVVITEITGGAVEF